MASVDLRHVCTAFYKIGVYFPERDVLSTSSLQILHRRSLLRTLSKAGFPADLSGYILYYTCKEEKKSVFLESSFCILILLVNSLHCLFPGCVF